jgi:DNA-binding MarR family transcriptional regulator
METMNLDDRSPDMQQQIDLLLCRLNRVHIHASRLVMHVCEREFGLARSEWRVLSFLSEHEGALSSELAEHAMLDRARTSRALTRLHHKRLIRREAQPSNRRRVHVYLTNQGWCLYREVLPHVAAINHELSSALTGTESAQLDRIVQVLQVRAQAMTASPRYALPMARRGR